MEIQLSNKDEIHYNAIEKKEHASAFMGKGRPMARHIYSVWKIENGVAFCQCVNADGATINERVPVDNLEPYRPSSQDRRQ